MVRPKLLYAATVWFPHNGKTMNNYERTQTLATEMVPCSAGLTYEKDQKKNLLSLGEETSYRYIN